MRYLGNKESIASVIKDIIIKRSNIRPDMVLFDAFCGTGSIANEFKTICNIRINDNLNCATHYTYGRLVGSNCKFEQLGFNPFIFFNSSEEIRNTIYREFKTIVSIDLIEELWVEGRMIDDVNYLYKHLYNYLFDYFVSLLHCRHTHIHYFLFRWDFYRCFWHFLIFLMYDTNHD